MTTIYLIRHAQAEEKPSATQRAKLTKKGIKQAEKLSHKLENKNIDVFYTSSYQRSRQTAEIISQPYKTKLVESDKTLPEVDFRIQKRLSLASFKELKNFYNQNEVEQIENLLKAQKRAIRFITYLFAQHENKNIAVVSHGNVIKSIILGILELKLSRFNKFTISDASVTILEGKTIEDVKITLINDTCHTQK